MRRTPVLRIYHVQSVGGAQDHHAVDPFQAVYQIIAQPIFSGQMLHLHAITINGHQSGTLCGDPEVYRLRQQLYKLPCCRISDTFC